VTSKNEYSQPCFHCRTQRWGFDVYLKHSFARQNGSLRAEGLRKEESMHSKSHLKCKAILSVSVNERSSANETECLEYKPEEYVHDKLKLCPWSHLIYSHKYACLLGQILLSARVCLVSMCNYVCWEKQEGQREKLSCVVAPRTVKPQGMLDLGGPFRIIPSESHEFSSQHPSVTGGRLPLRREHDQK